MMSSNMAPALLIFLLLIPGALGNVWNVTYNLQEICALKGSTVFINGTYSLPAEHTVKETYWIIDKVEKTNLVNISGYSGRVQYLDNQGKMSLSLSNVMKTDELPYFFRILAETEKWLGTPGVTLYVTDLQLISPPEVTEGREVILRCQTTCSLTDPTFIWYKYGRKLNTKVIKINELHFQPFSNRDGGSYSCAVKGYEHLPSPARTLGNLYPPKNASVSISPAGEIVEGISVTLTCIHDANPLLMNYFWFKGEISVETAKTYSISKITSEDSGEYKCMCSNEHGERNSTAVMLNVLYPPKYVSLSVTPSGETVEGSSLTLTCSSDANPPEQSYLWFKDGEIVRSGQSYEPPQSGFYSCEARNKLGSQRSAAVSLTVTGHSVILYVVVVVGLFGYAVLLAVIFWLRKTNKKKRSSEGNIYQNFGENAKANDDNTELDLRV